jgi:hypothetical protein
MRYELGFYIPEDGILHIWRNLCIYSCFFTSVLAEVEQSVALPGMFTSRGMRAQYPVDRWLRVLERVWMIYI